MKENTKNNYTANEFKCICQEFIPAIDKIMQAVRKNGIDGYVRITVNSEGYINMEGGGLSGWELSKYADEEEYTARYSYSERFGIAKEA